jgi:hypothetical protein
MMFGPIAGGTRAVVRGVLIGCLLGVMLVVAAVAFSAYRIAACLWGDQ